MSALRVSSKDEIFLFLKEVKLAIKNHKFDVKPIKYCDLYISQSCDIEVENSMLVLAEISYNMLEGIKLATLGEDVINPYSFKIFELNHKFLVALDLKPEFKATFVGKKFAYIESVREIIKAFRGRTNFFTILLVDQDLTNVRNK